MGSTEAKVMEARLKKAAQTLRKALKKHEKRAEHSGESAVGGGKQNTGEGLEMTKARGPTEKATKHTVLEMIGLTRSSS
jgi:hypothetical protein